ncbi:MAG: serine/threonine-protein kinase [Pseudomonadota bacterium]
MGEAREDSLLPPDSVVDHYRILQLLGRGGMGVVYLARDTKLGRQVALKMIRRGDLPSDRRAVERFLDEARITASFNHPHIVTVYGVGEYHGSPYLALEYVEGQTLWQRMREERLAAKEVMRIGLAIAQALAEAHRNRILHRDLKPENVVLARDGRLRVLDLGLAKLLPGDRTAMASPVLTPTSARQDARQPGDGDLTDDALASTLAPLPAAGDEAAMAALAESSIRRPAGPTVTAATEKGREGQPARRSGAATTRQSESGM